LFPDLISKCLLAVLTVAATTVILLLIGRNMFGRTIITLCYLAPVGWSAARWGPESATSAALAAFLALNTLFGLPAGTLVENLVVWLLLAVMLIGANVALNRLQRSLANGGASVYGEYLDGFVQELQAALAGLRTRQVISQALSMHLQQMLQVPLVEVFIQPGHSSPMIVRAPFDSLANGKPDRVLPILAAPDLMGEIRLWCGNDWLPPEDSYLFQNVTAQAALALERARLAEAEEQGKDSDACGVNELEGGYARTTSTGDRLAHPAHADRGRDLPAAGDGVSTSILPPADQRQFARQ